jgi:formate dehydrogenase subunit gamma
MDKECEGNQALPPQRADADLNETVLRLAQTVSTQRGALLPLLHAVQDDIGYIPDAAVAPIAQALNLSRAEVHGVVTFYHDFRRKPAGVPSVKVCRAESCQARGGPAVEKAAAHRLGVELGHTRPDGQVTLEAVYCLGLCATGPNLLVDGAPVSRVDPRKLDDIAERLGL